MPALTTTPAPLPATTLTRPTTTFTGHLLRTPDGSFIVGVITPTNASTYIFVYEVASGVILRNRTIVGRIARVLSMAPDGSRFMAGFTMYDTATLAVIGAAEQRQRAVHLHRGLQHHAERGRQHFHAGRHHAVQRVQHRRQLPIRRRLRSSSTLLVNDPTNLGIRLGIKLPESIVGQDR